MPTFCRLCPRKSSSAWLCTETSSAWNHVQMRCACAHVEWCSKNLYSASWKRSHSRRPAGTAWGWSPGCGCLSASPTEDEAGSGQPGQAGLQAHLPWVMCPDPPFPRLNPLTPFLLSWLSPASAGRHGEQDGQEASPCGLTSGSRTSVPMGTTGTGPLQRREALLWPPGPAARHPLPGPAAPPHQPRGILQIQSSCVSHCMATHCREARSSTVQPRMLSSSCRLRSKLW